MNILVIDIGGTGVKLLVTGATERRRFPSGPTMTPAQMVAGVKRTARGWQYDAVSIGYPGPVAHDHPVGEPPNLGRGWVGFDFARAFGKPVRILNDAAMQALGSYRGGKMLFLGLGTGMGSTLIVDGTLVPMELGHLPYRRSTFETHVGDAALERYGKRKWRARLDDVIARLTAAFLPDEVVLGGGNVRLLKTLPPRCRAGDNDNAFAGGFRLWAPARKPRGRK
ncbi:MAG: ROK family protein [Burkholderiales bacterium]|jgi:polyphosphate glucokinase|nr:ROK family protein [Burkholderiales bacterium]